MTLTLHRQEVHHLFRLLGADENSATYAVGWALDRCPMFLQAFLGAVLEIRNLPIESARITLQKSGPDGGYTDLEIHIERSVHVIIEAKAGWVLPTRQQLRRYAGRFAGRGRSGERLVTVSAAPTAIAARHGVKSVGSIPVVHLSWSDMRRLALDAIRQAHRLEEKRWLRELDQHLKEFVAMDRRSSNDVYVLALNSAPIRRGNPYTWIDVVEKDGRYFHPVGGAWPSEPPNYVGFRYGGRLRSVHHVEAVDVVEDLRSVDSRWPKITRDHFVYRLGPPMLPAKIVRTGNIYPSGRVRCAIDTLLSGKYRTIAEARDATKKRLREEG